MAYINNLDLGILTNKAGFRNIPTTRRYFAAKPQEALALIARLETAAAFSKSTFVN